MTVLIKVTIANRTKPYFYPEQRLRLVFDCGNPFDTAPDLATTAIYLVGKFALLL